MYKKKDLRVINTHTVEFSNKLQFTAVVQSGSGMASDGRVMFKPEHILPETFSQKGELKSKHGGKVIGEVEFFTKGEVTYARCSMAETKKNLKLAKKIKSGELMVSGEVVFFNADGSVMNDQQFSTATPEDQYKVWLLALALTSTPADQGAHVITTNFAKSTTQPVEPTANQQPDAKPQAPAPAPAPSPEKPTPIAVDKNAGKKATGKVPFKKKFKKQFKKSFKKEFDKCMKEYEGKWKQEAMAEYAEDNRLILKKMQELEHTEERVRRMIKSI